MKSERCYDQINLKCHKAGYVALIPQRLADLRKKRGLTQAQLAHLVHIDQQAIARYETGERSPKVDMLAKLADALAPCTVSYLIGRSPIPEGSVGDLSSDEQAVIAAIREGRSMDEIDALALRASKAQASKRRQLSGKR